MNKFMTSGGINAEPFWKSRRVWGAALSLVAAILLVAFPNAWEYLAPILVVIAGALGLTSWTLPKK